MFVILITIIDFIVMLCYIVKNLKRVLHKNMTVSMFRFYFQIDKHHQLVTNRLNIRSLYSPK